MITNNHNMNHYTGNITPGKDIISAPWDVGVAFKKLKALLNVDGVRLSRKDTNKRAFQIEHAVTITSFYSVEAASREEAEFLFLEGKVKKEWEDKVEDLDISKMDED